jgi:hypothetical protein
VLVVGDVLPIATVRRWILDFGEVLVAYRDPIRPILITASTTSPREVGPGL